MSAISNTSYILPPPRPWDPSRIPDPLSSQSDVDHFEWVEGKVVKGHPNICPLLDFFEDNHYYYLVLPSTIPEPAPNSPIPPSDLFDLVESYPNGLPASSVRTYLGQIADAMSFLHSKKIGILRLAFRRDCSNMVDKCIETLKMRTSSLGLAEGAS
jgi:protein-serine/threonine kinase